MSLRCLSWYPETEYTRKTSRFLDGSPCHLGSKQQSEWLDCLMWHRELHTDNVVGECICDGFLNNCGGGDQKVRMNIPYQYTSVELCTALGWDLELPRLPSYVFHA